MTATTDKLEEFSQLLKSLPEDAGASTELLLHNMGPRRADLFRRMAIPHQITAEIMCLLVPDLDPERADSLFSGFARLSTLSVVDNALLMHDDARCYLLNWWMTDEHNDTFRDLNARLADYFNNLDDTTTSSGIIKHNREVIYHSIGADPATGFSMFEKTFRQQRHLHALSRCAILIRLVQEYEFLLQPTQKLWLEYHDGKLLLDLYRYDESEVKLKNILTNSDIPDDLEIRVLYRIALLYYEQRHWRDAIEYLQRSMSCKAFGSLDPNMDHRIVDTLGLALLAAQELTEAEENLFKGLELARRTGDKEELAKSYNSIGQLHRIRNDASLAIEAFESSLSCLEDIDEKFKIAQVYNNLGLAWSDKANWEKSENFLKRSYEIERSAGDTRRQASALANLIRVYASQNRLDEAYQASDTAVNLSLQIHDWYSAAATMRSKAKILSRNNREEEAKKELAAAAALFEKCGKNKEKQSVDSERVRLDKVAKLPWYARTIIGIVIVFFLLIFLVMIVD